MESPRGKIEEVKMRQLIKWTLLLVICPLLLAPSAWGLSKDAGKNAVPWSDDSTIGEGASAPSGQVIIVFELVGGVMIPIIVDISPTPSDTPEPAPNATQE